MQIIVRNYNHINRSLPNWDTPNGKLIRSKQHYESEMKKAGMVGAENVKSVKFKDYKLTEKTQELIRVVKNSADRKGRVKLSEKTIDAMREVGAIGKKIPEYMKVPKNGKGGFA